MRRLGRILALDSGTLSPLLTRLEEAGLVQRQRGPDERSRTVALTDEGAALRERARSVPDGVLERLGMQADELSALHESLRELIAAATPSTS
jgi:DNA-binding MarR family transcriptional regulator